MGIFIAIAVMAAWAAHLWYILTAVEVAPDNPWMYAHLIVQAYFYTGLFITGHDAMHGVVAPKNKTVNEIIGHVAVFLFAGLSYKRLKVNHGKHHKYPATEKDPDYYVKSQNFWRWWAIFMWRYMTVSQIVIMALVYNALKYLGGVAEQAIVVFWIVPALLGTLQLFFFGTYLPHRLPHNTSMNPYRARTQPKNHLWAMISCYFFGYHYEHHDAPHTPWWQLYKTKAL